MVDQEIEIPVIGRLESGGGGLLRATAASSVDQRIEDWIASNLDASSETPSSNRWNSLIRNLPIAAGRSAPVEGRVAAKSSAWSRFQIAYKRGITVVRLVDQLLVQQIHIEELGLDLMDLIAAGNHRLVLNFSAVERLGSWIIGVVGQAHRACLAAEGGKLKLCGLDAPLAEIFEIVGMARDLELHAGEFEAIESSWPGTSGARALPVDLLGEMLDLGGFPPIRGGAPSESSERQDRLCLAKRPEISLERPSDLGLRAAMQVGGPGGRSRRVRIPAEGLMIGRDRECQVRIGSAQVSKRHASIEVRDGRLFARDLGSTNGTRINAHLVRGEERELFVGDTIQVGPIRSTVVIDDRNLSPASSPGPYASERDEPLNSDPAGRTADDLPIAPEDDSDHPIRHQVIEEVLIVKPQFEGLVDDSSLEALRNRLQTLFVADSPRRLVVDLEFVSYLSRKAVALLLSHHIRLEWAGGGLRICQAHARIIALLDQVRFTMLVDCYPTLDEAVLASWPADRQGGTPS